MCSSGMTQSSAPYNHLRWPLSGPKALHQSVSIDRLKPVFPEDATPHSYPLLYPPTIAHNYTVKPFSSHVCWQTD